MSHKGDAYAIATAIYAGTKDVPLIDTEVLADRLYGVVAGLGYTGDYSADLYAQLAEKLHCGTRFEHAVAIITSAIQRTEAKYG